MKPIPEQLNGLAQRFSFALKPVLLVFALMLVLLTIFGNTDEQAPVNARILTLVLAYGCVQSFFLLAVLFGFSQLKSEDFKAEKRWPYRLARLGEWVNGSLIIICNLLPLPVLIYLINRVIAAG